MRGQNLTEGGLLITVSCMGPLANSQKKVKKWQSQWILIIWCRGCPQPTS